MIEQTTANTPTLDENAPQESNLAERGQLDAGTRSSNLEQLADIADQTGTMKRQVEHLSQRVDGLHGRSIEAFRKELTELTEKQLKLSLNQVLTSLVSGYGMSWSDVARSTGVTQQAIRKWRHGGKPSPESRRRLAELAACVNLLDHAEVSDPASWLELPLVANYIPRRLDLFIRDRHQELIALARGDIGPETAISSLDPQWRDNLRSGHEVFLDTDGQLSIRAR